MDQLKEIARRRTSEAVAQFALAQASVKAARSAKQGCQDKKYSKFMKQYQRHTAQGIAAAAKSTATGKRPVKQSARRSVNPYQAVVSTDNKSATLYIYGDITDVPRPGTGDVSLSSVSEQLQALPDTVERVTVRINSYGGSVTEGVGIYNALKSSGLEVNTVCDGVAASIASVIFMAGKTRTMMNASMLFIHNAWAVTMGNAADHRKAADNLDSITNMSVTVYMEAATCSEEDLREMMNNETWLNVSEALDLGLATGTEADGAQAKARKKVANTTRSK